MANAKLTALTPLGAAPAATDLLYIVDNPSVTPLSKSVTVANLLGASHLHADNVKALFGTGSDAEIYYDATDLIINPDAFGSGNLKVTGNFDFEGYGAVGNGLAVDSSAGLRVSYSTPTGTATPRILDVRGTVNVSTGSSNAECVLVDPDGIVFTDSNTHPSVASIQFGEPKIIEGAATVTIASTLRIADAPTEGVNNYALFVDSGATRLDGSVQIGPTATPPTTNGALSVSGEFDCESYGTIGNGSAPIVNRTLVIDRDFSHATPTQFLTAGLMTINSGTASAYGASIAGTFEITSAGVHSIIAGLRVIVPVITSTSGSVTDAASIYVTGPPTAGTTGNYSLWVDAGDTRLDGDLVSGTAAGFALLSETSSSTNPTLIPDQTEPTSGIGGTGNEVSIIHTGTEVATALSNGFEVKGILTCNGTADLETYVSVGNGSTLNINRTLLVDRDFTATQNSSAQIYSTGDLTMADTHSAYGFLSDPGFISANVAHTYPTVAGMRINAPIIDNTVGATITSTATLVVVGAATEGASNYALSVTSGLSRFGGDLAHEGTNLGFYSATPAAKPTGVAVSAAGIHAALVTLGLIAA